MKIDRPHDFGKAIFALIVVQVLFGLHYPAAREVVAEIHPEAWSGIRVVGCALLLCVILAVKRAPMPKGFGEWWRLGVLAIFGVLINQWAFAEGMGRSYATHGVIIMSFIPLMSLILAVLIRQEPMSMRKMLSVLIGLCGMFVLLKADEVLAGDTSAFMRRRDGSEADNFLETVLAGDLMMVTNALSFSVFLVLSKHLTKTFSNALTMTTGLFIAGTFLMIPLVSADNLLEVDYAAVSAKAWLIGLVIIVGPTFGTYLLNIYALKRVNTSLVSIFIYLQVIVASSIGIIFQGDPIDWRLSVAAVLVLGGLSIRVLQTREATSNLVPPSQESDRTTKEQSTDAVETHA